MIYPKNIAVLGGTGKAGQYLVKILLSRGFSSRLLLRTPGKFPITNPLIKSIQGDARDYAAVERLLTGCDVVVSMLGQPKGEPSIFSQATRNVIRGMERFGIRRYILITGLNVDVPGDSKNKKIREATNWMKAHYPETTADKQLEFELLASSDIDWTMIRLPWIDQTESRFPLHASVNDCPGEKVSATDLAWFVVEQLSSDEYVRKAPFIANVEQMSM